MIRDLIAFQLIIYHYLLLEQQAKNERQQRFDNKISVLSVLIPLITFIIGVLIEH